MKSFEQSLLPGGDLVAQGLADLAQNHLSECALLLLVASPRLKELGLVIPEKRLPMPYEHALYERLEERLGTEAHSQYNSLIRRIVSFAHAREQELSVGRKSGST